MNTSFGFDTVCVVGLTGLLLDEKLSRPFLCGMVKIKKLTRSALTLIEFIVIIIIFLLPLYSLWMNTFVVK